MDVPGSSPRGKARREASRGDHQEKETSSRGNPQAHEGFRAIRVYSGHPAIIEDPTGNPWTAHRPPCPRRGEVRFLSRYGSSRGGGGCARGGKVFLPLPEALEELVPFAEAPHANILVLQHGFDNAKNGLGP
jgi:hypothetical protein